MSSTKLTLVVLCFVAALVMVVFVQANPLNAGKEKERQQQAEEAAGVPNDPLAMGADGSLFLAGGQDCQGPNEQLAPGALPTCEPTCSNPRPICPKVFFTNLDYVPCFCKKPLVRNENTKECVELSKCPAV